MKRQTRLFLSLFLSLISVLILMSAMGFFKTYNIHERMKIIADATTVPAILSLCLFALIRIGKSGLFDIFGYGVSRLSALLIPRCQVAHTSYYDYKTKVRTQSSSFTFLLLTGIVLLLFSVVFTVLDYKI